MDKNQLINRLPYGSMFRFADEILEVDEMHIVGNFTFRKELDFYRDHFKDHPVTPGVILTETMAQIGLVCFGLFLLGDEIGSECSVFMTSNTIDFIKPVYPGEKVKVTGKKVYFRFNKLSCNVKMENELGEVVCKGNIAGMLMQNHG